MDGYRVATITGTDARRLADQIAPLHGTLIGMPEEIATDPGLISLPDAAELLGVPIIRVHQLIKDGQLVSINDIEGRRCVPRQLVAAGAVLKGLSSVITLLRDGGYSDVEIVDWLFRADDSLPGTPAHALAENRGTEVKRRAQAAGF